MNVLLACVYSAAITGGIISALNGEFDWAIFCMLLAIATKPQSSYWTPSKGG